MARTVQTAADGRKYYVVVSGDTLSAIAADSTIKAHTGGKSYQWLAEFNDIPNANLIYINQKIYLTGAASTSTNNTSKAVIKHFGLQSDTTSTVFATWTWSKNNTENYQVKWEYDSGDGVWFLGTNSTVDVKHSIYNAPANAKRVRFTVKPISKTRKVNNKTSSYWTASWSTAKIYSFADNPPEKPGAPSITVEGLKLTASLEGITQNASIIQFSLHKDGSDKAYKTGKASVKTQRASFEFAIAPGSKYTVKCRAYKGGEYGDWSDFSDEKETVPATPKGFTKCILQGSKHDEVHLEWDACATATGYDSEYAEDQSYFDKTDKTTVKSVENVTQHTFIDEFAIDGENKKAGSWFFRLRAKNASGESGWSAVSTVTTGSVPTAPTTWSSTNTAIIGEPITLYWVHNTSDGSKETKAQIRLVVNDVEEPIITVEKSTAESEKDKTSKYVLDTTKYPIGATIVWSVSTMGEELTDGSSYSEWSTARTIYIYEPPTINLSVTVPSGDELTVLESFPFYISAYTEQLLDKQAPIGYYISIIANESYETVDLVGNDKTVLAGEVVYSNYIDTKLDISGEETPVLDNIPFSAGDVDLENNQSYTIQVIAHMTSGLTAKSEHEFEVAWSESETVCEPTAEILIDEDNYSAYIRPYCEDLDGNLIEGVTLAVYRREFDGSFTEIATNLLNEDNKFVPDPHPALDFARYRIVATTVTTGAVTYCDVPGVPVGCSSAIIQWDETWSPFDTSGNENAPSETTWGGSMVKLPYNIDISDKTKKDVELIEYVGRKRPVTYYGTQLGESSSWSMVIPKSDKDTLYALRRLSVWMGDVYVREPSGTGYWATISVNIPIKHRDVTIPITIDVTRVEGGI